MLWCLSYCEMPEIMAYTHLKLLILSDPHLKVFHLIEIIEMIIH